MAFWYTKRILAVLLLSLEIISFVLDRIGGSNRLFLIASFLLSAIGFVTTIYTSFFSSTVPAVTRSESERQLIAVDIVFSFIQLVLTFILLIRVFLGAKSNNNNNNNESLLPLAFAVISVVFIFRNNDEAQVVSDSASVSQIISLETPAVDDESAINRELSTLRRRRITSTQSKDGRKISVGDCALFKPPQDSPAFIGIIRSMTAGKENKVKFSVNWLYRPAEVKLGKGFTLESAPNEIFYSFDKDVIPASYFLHPCKVAFLPKGVELPTDIGSFVCRKVYDVTSTCLWWLTDQDYINERQEEVDQLLYKTRIEMHAAVPLGGRSPNSTNGPTSTTQKLE